MHNITLFTVSLDTSIYSIVVICTLFFFTFMTTSLGLTVILVALRNNTGHTQPPYWLTRIADFPPPWTRHLAGKIENTPLAANRAPAVSNIGKDDKKHIREKIQGELAVADERQCEAVGQILGYIHAFHGRYTASDMQASVARQWGVVVAFLEKISLWIYAMAYFTGIVAMYVSIPK